MLILSLPTFSPVIPATDLPLGPCDLSPFFSVAPFPSGPTADATMPVGDATREEDVPNSVIAIAAMMAALDPGDLGSRPAPPLRCSGLALLLALPSPPIVCACPAPLALARLTPPFLDDAVLLSGDSGRELCFAKEARADELILIPPADEIDPPPPMETPAPPSLEWPGAADLHAALYSATADAGGTGRQSWEL